MNRRLTAYVLVALLTCPWAIPEAWALARHAITATAKASGSRNLVVLPSASVLTRMGERACAVSGRWLEQRFPMRQER